MNKTSFKDLEPNIQTNITNFQTSGLSFLKTLSEDNLSNMLSYLNQLYYENTTSLISDDLYDILREYILKIYPDNNIALNGHKTCFIRKKVKLPCNMPSMDKLKDKKSIDNWFKKYGSSDDVKVVTAKLDGVSGLYCYIYDDELKEFTHKLFTRGNGTYGQDISYLIQYLNLPNLNLPNLNLKKLFTSSDIIIRGEFIIPKLIFKEKYSKSAANPRNFVAGIINSNKNIDLDKIKDIDFVAYELITPICKPSLQIKYLMKDKFNVVKTKISTSFYNSFNNNSFNNSFNHEKDNIKDNITQLSNILINWRDSYKYEIDGIICTDDNIYKRTSDNSNPEHSFAFKMVLSEQIAETLVINVIWNPSKDGYLKPTVQIQPVFLSGAEINYVTGCNAKNIIDNGIGIGSKISVIRSGDVIPDIQKVLIPVKPCLPNLLPNEYSWNKTKVDFVLNDLSLNKDVNIKIILKFFKTIKVDGIGEGIIIKLYNASFDTIEKILTMTRDDFINIEGFKDKLADKLYLNIKNSIKNASLSEIIVATNIFGRGFGLQKINSILNNYPNVLSDNIPEPEKVNKLSLIDGIAVKTATYFVENIYKFNNWLSLTNILKSHDESLGSPSLGVNNLLVNKKIVISGKRDKELINKLKFLGSIESNTITQDTFALIVESLDLSTSKVKKANKYNINIYTNNDFKEKYFK